MLLWFRQFQHWLRESFPSLSVGRNYFLQTFLSARLFLLLDRFQKRVLYMLRDRLSNYFLHVQLRLNLSLRLKQFCIFFQILQFFQVLISLILPLLSRDLFILLNFVHELFIANIVFEGGIAPRSRPRLRLCFRLLVTELSAHWAALELPWLWLIVDFVELIVVDIAGFLREVNKELIEVYEGRCDSFELIYCLSKSDSVNTESFEDCLFFAVMRDKILGANASSQLGRLPHEQKAEGGALEEYLLQLLEEGVADGEEIAVCVFLVWLQNLIYRGFLQVSKELNQLAELGPRDLTAEGVLMLEDEQQFTESVGPVYNWNIRRFLPQYLTGQFIRELEELFCLNSVLCALGKLLIHISEGVPSIGIEYGSNILAGSKLFIGFKCLVMQSLKLLSLIGLLQQLLRPGFRQWDRRAGLLRGYIIGTGRPVLQMVAVVFFFGVTGFKVGLDGLLEGKTVLISASLNNFSGVSLLNLLRLYTLTNLRTSRVGGGSKHSDLIMKFKDQFPKQFKNSYHISQSKLQRDFPSF